LVCKKKQNGILAYRCQSLTAKVKLEKITIKR